MEWKASTRTLAMVAVVLSVVGGCGGGGVLLLSWSLFWPCCWGGGSAGSSSRGRTTAAGLRVGQGEAEKGRQEPRALGVCMGCVWVWVEWLGGGVSGVNGECAGALLAKEFEAGSRGVTPLPRGQRTHESHPNKACKETTWCARLLVMRWQGACITKGQEEGAMGRFLDERADTGV